MAVFSLSTIAKAEKFVRGEVVGAGVFPVASSGLVNEMAAGGDIS